MSKWILDASALLAVLNGESGSEQVEEMIPDAQISAVNFSEVVAKLIDSGMPDEAAREALSILGVQVTDFTRKIAFEAGRLRPATRKLGLSLGDRACLATARVLGLPAVTTDKLWLKQELKIKILCVR